jgi:hypothetical protein
MTKTECIAYDFLFSFFAHFRVTFEVVSRVLSF